jgi:hypothetical protein
MVLLSSSASFSLPRFVNGFTANLNWCFASSAWTLMA